MTHNTFQIPGPVTVTISGPQGAGKSTVARAVREAISSLGIADKVTVVEKQTASGTEAA